MSDAPTLPDRLRELRDAQGLTRGELAAASGVSERTIADIEQGVTTRPAYDTFLGLAAGLGVAPGELAAPPVDPPPRRGRGRPPARK